MANTVTNTANINVIATEDTTQNVLINRSFQPSLDQIFSGSAYYVITPDTNPHVIVFPISVTVLKHFYIRHLGAPGSGSILISPALPTTTSPTVANDVILLGPGDVFLYWQDDTGAPPAGASNIVQGIAAGVTYEGSAANIPFEYFGGA